MAERDESAWSGPRMVLRHPGHLLLPTAIAAAAGSLAATLVTVVRAWTAPTLLRDGEFTFAGTSTTAIVTIVIAAVLVAVTASAATALVALLAAAHELGRRPGVRAALREVTRRWALVLLGGVMFLAVVAAVVGVLVVAVSMLPVVPAVLVAVVVVVVVAGLSAPVIRVFPVALVQGLGARAAWRLLREQLRTWSVQSRYGSTGRLTIGTIAAAAAVGWAMTRVPEGLGHPAIDAAQSIVWVVVGALVLAVLAVEMSRAHVEGTQLAAVSARPVDESEDEDEDVLVWPGLDRVAPPADAEAGTEAGASTEAGATSQAVPADDAGTPRRIATSAPWAGVVAAWAVAPLAILAVVTTNPTQAIEPVAVETDVTFDDYGSFLVPSGDGVVAASNDEFTYCTPEDGCRLPQTMFETHTIGAAADPAGAGIALLGEEVATSGGRRYVLRTCDPSSCDTGDDDPVTEARVFGDAAELLRVELTAAAAQDGAYAVIYEAGEEDDGELTLARCATASCTEPRTVSLGDHGDDDVVRATFAPDGTLWVLQTTAGRDTVRLRSLAPDATTLVDALTLEIPSGEYGYTYSLSPHRGRPAIFELAVRDDGTPVVLYRDTSDRSVVLVDCQDARCETTTSTRLPFDRVMTYSARLAVDSTGRPLISVTNEHELTVTDDGRAYRQTDVLLYSCEDRACASMDSGLVATSDTGGMPLMVLDAQERPRFWATHDYGPTEVLFCSEPRCGL